MAKKKIVEEEEGFNTGALITTSEDLKLHRPKLELPSYESVTDSRVIKELKTVFPGYEFDLDMKAEYVFKSVDQIVDYTKHCKEDIDTFDDKSKRTAILNSGAIAARRWQFGYVICKCLESKAYGTGVAEKIATAAGVSLPYIYQYKTVGENLSMKDAYILGMYGAGWDSIRELATIKDPLDRELVIKKFVESIPDYNDGKVRETAKAALGLAIKAIKARGTEPLDVSNVASIEANLNLGDLAPEYVEVMKLLKRFDAAMAKVSKESVYEDMTRALEQCYISSNVAGAEDKLSSLKTLAETIIKRIDTAANLFKGLKEQLDSVSGMTVEQAEEEPKE